MCAWMSTSALCRAKYFARNRWLPIRTCKISQGLVRLVARWVIIKFWATRRAFVFSLLKQNWHLASQLGTPSICDDILSTALDIVLSLPPLSLANEAKLTKLGTKTLDQTTTFLKTVFSVNSGADHHGRMLASQLMLSLAAQRGSLKCLLEWVELAIMTSSRGGDTQVEGGLSDNKITWQLFKDVVTEMMKAAVSSFYLTIMFMSTFRLVVCVLFVESNYLLILFSTEKLHFSKDSTVS